MRALSIYIFSRGQVALFTLKTRVGIVADVASSSACTIS